MTDPVFEPSSHREPPATTTRPPVVDKPFDLDELRAAALRLAQPGEP